MNQNNTPERLKDLIYRVLRNYRQTEVADEYGDGYPLVDALTITGHGIDMGEREIANIAEMLAYEIARADRAPPAAQEPDAVRHSFDGDGWLYSDHGNGSDWFKRAMLYPDAEPLYAAPQPASQQEAVTDREEVAFALWCEEAGNTTLRRHRTRKGWNDQSVDTHERFLRFADAALRALKGREQ